jgi:signal transduction histidine kinase
VRYGSEFMGVEIRKDLSPLPLIKASRGEMQQVFINILNNAIQAMGGKGTITIVSRYGEGRLSIAVSDTGPGIRREDLPLIFDLFYTTKKPGEGTGQGLYIVRKILGLNGGDIRVTSTEGEGATFHVEFRTGRGKNE